MDLPSAADPVLSAGHHSEPDLLEQVGSVLEIEFVETLFIHREQLRM
jgi:hypothetical protein